MADAAPSLSPPAGLTLHLWRSSRARPGKGRGGGGGRTKQEGAQTSRAPTLAERARCSSSSDDADDAGSGHGDSDASASSSSSSSSPSLDGWGGSRPGVARPAPSHAQPPLSSLTTATSVLGRWFSGEAARFNAAHGACPPSTTATASEEEFIALASRRARALCGAAMGGVVELVRVAGGSGGHQARLAAAVWRAGSRAAADAVEALTSRAMSWRDRALAAERVLEAHSGGVGPAAAAVGERRRPASRLPTTGRRPSLFPTGPPGPGAPLPPPSLPALGEGEGDDGDTDRAAALAAAAAEVRALTARLAAAEAGADAAVDALSRADAAEAAASDALARLGARTPRPDPPVTGAGVRALVSAGAAGAGPAVAAAVRACRGWAARDTAALLLGDDAAGSTRGAAFTNPDALGCLHTAWKAGTVSLSAVAAALDSKGGGGRPALATALPPGSPHGAWLEGRAGAGLGGARADALALFLCGCDGKGRPVPVEVYGTVPVRVCGCCGGGDKGPRETERNKMPTLFTHTLSEHTTPSLVRRRWRRGAGCLGRDRPHRRPGGPSGERSRPPDGGIGNGRPEWREWWVRGRHGCGRPGGRGRGGGGGRRRPRT